jgi:hypothetical protein
VRRYKGRGSLHAHEGAPQPVELPSPLRAITLWQPYAWALVFAGKDVENRPRSLGVTGWVAVHVGLHWDSAYICEQLRAINAFHPLGGEPPDFGMGPILDRQLGHIIGLVRINRWLDRRDASPSPWLQPPPGVAAVITDRVPLRTPVLCREGFHRGAWRVPSDVEQAVRGQVP